MLERLRNLFEVTQLAAIRSYRGMLGEVNKESWFLSVAHCEVTQIVIAVVFCSSKNEVK